LSTHMALGIATVVTVARFVAYTISDRDRWRRCVFLLFLVLGVAVGWWLLADGGIHVLQHDFGSAGIT